MSYDVSVSVGASCSKVPIQTRLPSDEAPCQLASKLPFPPEGPVETRVVVPPVRWYTSCFESVSWGTSDSLVSNHAIVPSAEDPEKNASTVPLPPVGPVDTRLVVPAERS